MLKINFKRFAVVLVMVAMTLFFVVQKADAAKMGSGSPPPSSHPGPGDCKAPEPPKPPVDHCYVEHILEERIQRCDDNTSENTTANPSAGGVVCSDEIRKHLVKETVECEKQERTNANFIGGGSGMDPVCDPEHPSVCFCYNGEEPIPCKKDK